MASVGPASRSPHVLAALLDAGTDVVRLNVSHGGVDATLDQLRAVRRAARAAGRPVGVLADLPGPKVRAASFGEGGVDLDDGATVRLVDAAPDATSDASTIAIDLAGATAALRAGDVVPLGDGGLRLLVEGEGEPASARVLGAGRMAGRPGVTLPDGRVELAAPTPGDLAALERLVAADVDAVGLSFVRSSDDVAALRRAAGPGGPMIVAKIETAAAVDALDDVVHAADGVMVARGDLGVRVPLEEVPHIQKRVIRAAVAHGKPVITATQMLESMVTSPVPTRAEVTDVANAVFDGTSAVMLSGETAVGAHPVEAVAAMARITARADQAFDHQSWGLRLGQEQMARLADAPATVRITSAITAAAWRVSMEADLAAIVACTRSGATARMISRFRPRCPILAATPSARTARQLAMAWGIQPILVDEHPTTDDIVWHAVERAAALGLVRPGDLAAVLAGSPSDTEPTTDVLRLVRVR